MIAVALGLLAAAANALASVLQRRASKNAPAGTFGPTLILDMVRQPLWLGGIAALIAAFGLQAAALSEAGLALIQPILAAELPFTMILIAWLPPRGFRRVPWTAVTLLSVGLAVLLIAASPAQGGGKPAPSDWVFAVIATVGCAAGLVTIAWLIGGPVRAVLLGVTTSLGFALTAAFMKEVTEDFADGVLAVLTTWSLYAMALTGLASLLLLQGALHAGSLVVVQPALTVTDPVASILLGVALFDERLRGGSWIVLEIAGVALILAGSIGIARSPLLHEEHIATRGDGVTRAPNR
ncbi:DMT family transporter [Actinomadura chokoriensis]|uniref:DMT family transporter n=1 Tax=Actinomadura chokoriensis TaxID=454156 RepID=A0ABV4QQY6_9ACTN